MRYFLLRQDARLDQWHTRFVEGVALDAPRAGLPMAGSLAPVRVTVAAGASEPSDFLELPVPIVSDAMRRALDGAGVDNVQYFPAHVVFEYADAEAVATDYWIANIVGAVACVAPWPAARTAPATSGVRRGPFRSFAIDPARAHGFGLFRLAEDRRLLVVSERVAAALHGAALRGVVLQDPESYTGLPVNSGPPAVGDVRDG